MMNLNRIEIGKMFVGPNVSDRPDFTILYSSFEKDPFPLVEIDKYDKVWLQSGIYLQDTPFIFGKNDNYRGLGNIACGLLKNSNRNYIFFQLIRRREHELYGLTLKESIEDSSYIMENDGKSKKSVNGSRMFNQCAFTQINLDNVVTLLKEQTSLSRTLIFQNKDTSYRLPYYQREIREQPPEVEAKSLVVNDYSPLLRIIINWLLSNRENLEKKICILVKNMDINQKLIFIDQLQYYLFPFIGVVTYQFEYVSMSSSIQIYVFDYDRYYDFF